MGRKATGTKQNVLEHMLLDETAKPKALPLSLLDDITGGFSDDQKIGSGGFAVVYKGKLGHRAVAVKRLSNAYMHETEFHREVECLMRAKHKNIVRFLGYCADRQGIMEKYNGKLVMADVHQRLLCFEYIPKGSLDKYISDAYREWGTCYKIIKGICKGLQYLHENNIIHLDLKPANILLDDSMVPKITDFGLSRCFSENQSHDITKTILGTLGYLAPELREGGVIARSVDLYSLGVIIMEILTGQKGYEAIGDVLESWSGRLQRSQQDTVCEQIRVCYETALECRDYNPKKRPTSAQKIIDRLHEMESIQTAEASSSTSSGVKATKVKRMRNSWVPKVFRFVPTLDKASSTAEGPLRRGSRHRPVESKSTLAMKADEVVEMAGPSEGHFPSHEGYNVYYSPKLMYLKVVVIEAGDLVSAEEGRPLAPTSAKIQHGEQIRRTRPGKRQGSPNPFWNEEFMFVVSEPFEDYLCVTVEECVGPGREELVGRMIMQVNSPYVPRNDMATPVPSNWTKSNWFKLSRPIKEREGSKTFDSTISLRMSLETGYNVLDESAQYASDLQPADQKLPKSAIGILEVDILGVRDLEAGMKNPYVVAKYGAKWVRTRTLLGTEAQQWNERYTWDVFDTSTVITVAIFNLATQDIDGSRDHTISKVRVRLSTLESARKYTHYYPLMALSASGLKKSGELHLAVRFTCTSWANMLAQCGLPRLPNLHYTSPLSVMQQDYLRTQATKMVAAHLGRAERPLRREVVEYMLDVDSHLFSMRKSKANFYRVTSLFSGALAVGKWFDGICKWKNPLSTILVHVMFVYLVCYPRLILPMVFLFVGIITAWNYRRRPQLPPLIDTALSYLDQVLPDELEEEFDTFPTSKPDDIVQMRYERLRNLAGKLQTEVGDLAMQAERALALVHWHDQRATLIFITLSLALAVLLYLTPTRVVATVMGLYFLRPPWFRSTTKTNLLFNFFSRLPSNDDVML